MNIKSILIPIFASLSFVNNAEAQSVPFKIGVVGLTHDHVHWIMRRSKDPDIEMVGIVEENKELAKKYAQQYGFSMDIVFNSIESMIEVAKPEAVTAFGSIYSHLEVVEVCAPAGIHVMVEKPLAVSLKHAKKMEALAKKHKIQLLTNYETTWYPTNYNAYDLVKSGDIGPLRKIVVHDGHQGPKEIGVSNEFLAWLTDPVLNGAGALTDFGCYGANLITWLANGKRPKMVTALTQTFKPQIYPNVDDEATILLGYDDMQGIIQASWNWPVSRKDMEVYGAKGVVFSDNRLKMRYQLDEKSPLESLTLPERPTPYNDPFMLLEAVVHNKIQLSAFDLSSLENNMIVVEILEAAKKSAKTGKTIRLK